MHENKLSPYDIDMAVMIERITGQKVFINCMKNNIGFTWPGEMDLKTEKAVQEAIVGRLGDRFIALGHPDDKYILLFKYDPATYGQETRFELTLPKDIPEARYCRRLKEVTALRLIPDQFEKMVKFTGGGFLTEIPGTRTKFEFPDQNGLFLTVYEGDFVVKEENGFLWVCNAKLFLSEYESKFII